MRAFRPALVILLLCSCAAVASAGVARKPPSSPGYTFSRLSDPPRTVVSDAATGRWLATFTDGASTVTLAGTPRVFGEGTTTATVTSSIWIRELPHPFAGTVDAIWLAAELADGTPDVLALAMQYITGAPTVLQGPLRIAGDADYGPLGADSTRQSGSDFNDYLGISWSYGSTTDDPEPDENGSLDCSGFVRMVFGYRLGLPLSLSTTGTAIPRRSFEMLDSAPGVATIPNAGVQVTAFSRLSPGDLVFFDASSDDGTRIDHVGIYLGQDGAGHERFLSSRKSANGPTLGDIDGKSILDGSGYYATAFRAARRL